jgi:adenosylmethionine-8-amino-7-oxononanoate aminotransferase
MSVGRTTAFHKPYFPLLFKVHYAPTPKMGTVPLKKEDSPLFRSDEVGRACLQQLEALLARHAARVAAVCIEPIVQGAAGMIVHPEGFLRGVRALCDEYDVLLIADEVAVGFGRTGKMFACEHEDVSPDLMCVAKGISGGYLPLAATLATQRIFDAFLGEPWDGRTFFHGHTYTGNPLACAAALASLDLFEKTDLVRAVQRKSQELSAMLAPLRGLPHVGDVRQKGFMVGIELVADKETRRPFDSKRRLGAEVCAKIRRHRVIVRPLGDVIVLMPPLAMGTDDLRKIVDAVAAELADAATL